MIKNSGELIVLAQPLVFRVSGISGMEWWNGLLEWNTGMDWDKIFALAQNLLLYESG